MHPLVYERLKKEKRLLNYVRENPSWYRYLSRDPEQIKQLEEIVKEVSRSEIPNKIEKFHKNMNMLKFIFQAMQEGKQ